MPGPLTAAHAEYEADCENCHSPFDREEMTALCLDCHESVAQDRLSNSGFHGQSTLASTNNCESCHTDHEGRATDITSLLPDNFDHSSTRFLLNGAHQPLSCQGCHEDGALYRDTPTSCADCHEQQDIHKGVLSDSCDTCHQPQSWQELLEFDHDTTDFALAGLHLDLSCNNCHISQQYEFKDTGCVTCHSATDVHGGIYGDKCESCHIVEGWKEVGFDHEETSFPLRGAHEDTRCVSCHFEDQVSQPSAFDQPSLSSPIRKITGNDQLEPYAQLFTATARTCNDCHGNDDIHFGRNGTECESCHNNEEWSQWAFDHNNETDFPLTGNHEDVACTQCHTGSLTDPVADDCITCHLSDDKHQDPEMSGCENCHTTTGWQSGQFFDHDFSVFPLLGMHRIAPCESCHLDNQLTTADSECASCHKPDDVHQGAQGTSCNQCHTPNAWEIWQFSHTEQTDYPLQGQHENLACDSCHLPDTVPADAPTQCSTCHERQDIHRGEFGLQCDQCHNTNDFSEILLKGRRL